MKKIATFILSICLAMPLVAQSEYLSAQRNKAFDYPFDDETKCGVIIVSGNYDLVINVTNAAEEVSIGAPELNQFNNLYEYKILLDRNDTRNPNIEINRRGNAYKTNFVASVKPMFFVGYQLEEVANPIRIEDQTKGTDAILNAEKAELEFTTTLETLQIDCPPEIVLSRSSKKKEGDDKLTIISIILSVEKLQEAEENVKSTQEAYLAQYEYIKKKGDKAQDSDWAKLDELDAAQKTAEEQYNKFTTVTIYCDNSNKINIDISDLGPRSKKCYVVIPLIIEKEIYKTEYSKRMSEGGNLFNLRKYEEAKIAFNNALSAKDIVADIIPTIKSSIALCDSCIKFEKIARKATSGIDEIKAKGGTQEKVALYAAAALRNWKKLNAYKPDELYAGHIANIEKIIEDMPVLISFTIVEWKNLQEGKTLGNIEVWAYYGKEKISSNDFLTDKKFRKAISNSKADYKQLATSGADGKAKITLKKEMPTGFIFRPTDNDDVKIYYKDAKEIISRARGSYKEQQHRIRMYTK